EEAEAFRVLSEFDGDRAELFLARAALLVEGRTEKLAFPFVFEALGIEPDKGGSWCSSAEGRATSRSSRGSATHAASRTSSSTTATPRRVSDRSSRRRSSTGRSSRSRGAGGRSCSLRT